MGEDLNQGLRIRNLNESEFFVLELFLYEAIFQREGEEKLPKTIILQPELQLYIENFGKESDHCLVAEVGGEIVGAVWTRILVGELKGFGSLNSKTPEFALSVKEEFRGEGIGKRLMTEMLILLKEKGYQQASLAVQKDNFASQFYQKLGFKIIAENEEEYIMSIQL